MPNQEKFLPEIRGSIKDLRSSNGWTPREAAFCSNFDPLFERDAGGGLMPFDVTSETRDKASVDGAGGGKPSLVNLALECRPAL